MTLKLLGSWLLGGAFVSASIWLISHSEYFENISSFGSVLVSFIGFVFILLAGLLWISVATATSKH
jgi:hypothetical protein